MRSSDAASANAYDPPKQKPVTPIATLDAGLLLEPVDDRAKGADRPSRVLGRAHARERFAKAGLRGGAHRFVRAR